MFTDVKDHIIIYTRIINNINLQNLKRASAFIDINDRKVDQEAVKLLAHYRHVQSHIFFLLLFQNWCDAEYSSLSAETNSCPKR